MRQQAETDSATRLNCPMPTSYGRVRVCNHSDYTFSGAGKATIRVRLPQGHIQRGKVRVKNSTEEAARRPLLCQEIGHTLGLDHRQTTASCMHQNASAAANSPDGHDYGQLENQTHSHGGESLTGGTNGDLDRGGGIQDGCDGFVCVDVESTGDGEWLVQIEWFGSPPPFIRRLLHDSR